MVQPQSKPTKGARVYTIRPDNYSIFPLLSPPRLHIGWTVIILINGINYYIRTNMYNDDEHDIL